MARYGTLGVNRKAHFSMVGVDAGQRPLFFVSCCSFGSLNRGCVGLFCRGRARLGYCAAALLLGICFTWGRGLLCALRLCFSYNMESNKTRYAKRASCAIWGRANHALRSAHRVLRNASDAAASAGDAALRSARRVRRNGSHFTRSSARRIRREGHKGNIRA